MAEVIIGHDKLSKFGSGEGRYPQLYRITNLVIFLKLQFNISNFGRVIYICFNWVAMVIMGHAKLGKFDQKKFVPDCGGGRWWWFLMVIKTNQGLIH